MCVRVCVYVCESVYECVCVWVCMCVSVFVCTCLQEALGKALVQSPTLHLVLGLQS